MNSNIVSKSKKVIVAFDLDGVLVDNIAFEQSVTNYIIKKISNLKDIPINEAREKWTHVLKENQEHPEWHDYSFHCKSLDLGDVWKEAHIRNASLLKKYTGVDDAISIAKDKCDCWIITDATEWVAKFKLSCIDHANNFSEIFSSSRCGYSKSFDDFWHLIYSVLPDPSTSLIFIENRIDLLCIAKSFIKGCVPIWIDTPDHPNEIGIYRVNPTNVKEYPIQISDHDSLPDKLRQIIDECYMPE